MGAHRAIGRGPGGRHRRDPALAVNTGGGGGLTVFITGATGNIGTALITALVADDSGQRIVGASRRRPDWRPPKTEWVEANVATDDLTAAMGGADVVVHLAW